MKIPNIEIPNIDSYQIDEKDEEIISLSEAGFMVDSQYYKKNIKYAYKDCYVRKSVVEKLKQAEKKLPNGIKFKIYDAYRPISIQQELWDFYKNEIIKNNPELTNDEVEIELLKYVSRPSYDVNNPSLHNTGGAVDLTLVNEDGIELEMGTEFDEFSEKSWTSYYEANDVNEIIKNNRRLLYNVMMDVGFSNLPSEWWHYEYGTKYWSYFNSENALYKGVLDIDFKNSDRII